MIEIKDELTAHLEAAKARYSAARQAAEEAEGEIRVLDGVLARFDELAKDNTRAFRVVPPASGPIQNAPQRPAPNQTVPDRSAPAHCQRCEDRLNFEYGNWLGPHGSPTCHGGGAPHIPVTAPDVPATPAQPSPPPATAPEPASEHESDPVRRVDLSATQGGDS